MKINYHLNGLGAAQLQNMLAHVVAGDPSTPGEGQFWYDSTTGKIKWKAAAGVIDPTARSNHTGTQSTSTLSDFAVSVTAFRLDQFAAPTASVSFNGQRITNLAAAASGTDAVTLNDLNTAIANSRAGIKGVKDPVRVVAQANVNLAAPGTTIDGVTMASGDRFLAPSQTTTTQNGIYVWNGAAAAATRATDADAAGEVVDGTIVPVAEGTDAGAQYMQTASDGGAAPGAYSQTWQKFNTGGTTYSAGSGLSLTGTTFAVKQVAGGGITTDGSNNLIVDKTIVATKLSGTMGDGTTTAITVTHNLGTKDITASVREVATDDFVDCDIKATSTTTATFTFLVAPTASSLRWTIIG